MSELILIGGLHRRHHTRVRDFCLETGAPIYAEPLSGLREDPSLVNLQVRNERMLSRANFTRVIRIGNVPTLRFWRDLDESLSALEVENYSDLPFPGLARGTVRPLTELQAFKGVPRPGILDQDRNMALRFEQILEEEPQSELSMLRTLSKQIPIGARVYLGNSLPIREWDLAATREQRNFTIGANRGANGIDGQLSTFFGWCSPTADNWCIVGDLTALYDLNAPWIVPQLDARFRIVIINNGGGRIFSRVPSLQKLAPEVRETLIENAHDLTFENWAAMWAIAPNVIEMRPDANASRRAWERYDRLWA